MSRSEKEIDVLLVEDHMEYADMFEQWLQMTEKTRFRVELAPRLRDAMTSLSLRPDVIVTDLGLPDASGLDAVKSLMESTPQTPLVVLTVNEDLDTCMEALDAGAQDFIIKGRHAPEFYGRILLQAIERKSMQETLRLQQEELDFLGQALTVDLKDSLISLDKLTGRLREYQPRATPTGNGGRTGAGYVVDGIETAIDQIDGLVEEVDRFVRYRSGRGRVEPVSLLDLVREAIAIYSGRAKDGGVTLRGEFRTDRTQLKGDPLQLRHMLTGLLEHVIDQERNHEAQATIGIDEDRIRGLLVLHIETSPRTGDSDPGSIDVLHDSREPSLAIATRVARNHDATLHKTTSKTGAVRLEVWFPMDLDPGGYTIPQTSPV